VTLKKIGQFNNFTKQYQSIDDHNDKVSFLYIETLNLTNNQIDYIALRHDDSDRFKNLKIDSIILRNNSLGYLSFDNNINPCYLNLKFIDISRNNLTSIEISYFIHVKRLEASFNQLDTVDMRLISDAINRKESTLNTNYYCNLKQVKTATTATTSLKNESIQSVYESELEYLDLSFNLFSELPFFYSDFILYNNLICLNLSNNYLPIPMASLKTFESMPNIEILVLSGNKLRSIHRYLFNPLIHLKYLDLGNNQLTQIAPVTFIHQNYTLRTLILSNNNLKEVPTEAFRMGARHVKYLDLSHNQISFVENYSFGFMLDLFELYLSFNQIENVDNYAFSIHEDSLIGNKCV
jgi:Leucine-rich repeat (LRR) protein